MTKCPVENCQEVLDMAKNVKDLSEKNVPWKSFIVYTGMLLAIVGFGVTWQSITVKNYRDFMKKDMDYWQNSIEMKLSMMRSDFRESMSSYFVENKENRILLQDLKNVQSIIRTKQDQTIKSLDTHMDKMEKLDNEIEKIKKGGRYE